MRNPSNEGELVRIVKDWAERELHGFFIKIHGSPFQLIGLPDLIGCVRGRFIGAEAKLPGKEKNLTRRQSRILQLIKRAGGISFMFTTLEEFREKLEEEMDP